MYVVVSYSVYLAASLAVTIAVARSLHRNGRIFLVEAFHGNAEMADSVNRLLGAGFYLLNIGYVTLALATSGTVAGARQAIELVCGKLGFVLLVAGLLHFVNLYAINRMRRRAQDSPVRYGRHRDLIGRILD
jgi:hypothetical protein